MGEISTQVGLNVLMTLSKQHSVKIHNSVISDLPSGRLRILYIVHVDLENVNCLLSSNLETTSGCSSV